LNTKIISEDYEESGLPKINLITFDGDRTKWKDFRNLFKALEISPIKKMCVSKAEAVEVIAKIKIIPKGYSTTWKGLLVHFDNPR